MKSFIDFYQISKTLIDFYQMLSIIDIID